MVQWSMMISIKDGKIQIHFLSLSHFFLFEMFRGSAKICIVWNISLRQNNWLLFTHFPLVEKKLLCFCDQSLFLLQILLSVSEQILWQKLFFLLWQKLFPSSMTKICFYDRKSDRNLFLRWKLVSWRKLFLWQNFLSDKNF